MPSIVEGRRARRERGLRELLKEVLAQVSGSDLETGYTFIYVWLANEFGHFMIGFPADPRGEWRDRGIREISVFVRSGDAAHVARGPAGEIA